MTDREKLIELLKEADYFSKYICGKQTNCQLCDNRKYGMSCQTAFAVDHLLSHGVTFEKQGEWKGSAMDSYCSICGVYQNMFVGRTNYCPNCGARMKGAVNNE